MLALFGDVLGIVEQAYVVPVDNKKLIEAALAGMMTALDPHSNYLAPDGYSDLQERTSGEYSGVGLTITAIRLAIHAGGIHHLARDVRKMSGDLAPIRLRRVNPRQLQGNGRDIEFQIRQAAGGFDRAAWFGGMGDCHQP
jgi:hypothetical protein